MGAAVNLSVATRFQIFCFIHSIIQGGTRVFGLHRGGTMPWCCRLCASPEKVGGVGGGGGGRGDSDTFFFLTWKKLWRNIHKWVVVLYSSTYMTASEQTSKNKEENHRGQLPPCPPPPPMALPLVSSSLLGPTWKIANISNETLKTINLHHFSEKFTVWLIGMLFM